MAQIKSWHFLSPHMKTRYLDEIAQIEAAIEEQELRLTVFGEFSSGKSTFLNAIIGKDLLPHEMTETTATITYIHNVPQDDERVDSIMVEFVDEHEPVCLSLEDSRQTLKDYLTTKSSVVDVATAVRSVHIFCHIFDSTHRLVLIDTPGLNGMAEHHRDITIEELRRSHVSICMFSQKGLMESEVPNLQELLKYQQEFIFVMNFLDRLNVDEGDSAESQLVMLREQLARHVPGLDVRAENIFIISALYALAGRDKCIKRLYHGDKVDLTDAGRGDLLKQSGIIVLEDYLKNLSEEKFSSYLVTSLRYKIAQMVKRIEQEVDYCQAQANLIAGDVKEKQRLIKEGIDRRQNLFESRKKDLQRFVNEKCMAISRALQTKLNKENDSWLESQLNQIETLNIDDASAVQRFIQQVNDLAVSHHRGYRQQVKDMLTAIYRDGILRADAYYPKIREVIERQVSFELGQHDNQAYSYADQIAKYDERIENSRRRLAKAEREQAENAKQIQEARVQLVQAKNEREKLRNQCEQALARLGMRPEIEQRAITKEREVERSFFGMFDIPFTSKTEKYTVYEEDTSQRDAWENRRQSIQFESRGKIETVERRIRELKRKIERAEQDNNTAMVNEYKEQLTATKQDKQRRIAEINEFKKNAQREFFQAERKRLKKSLLKYRVQHFNAMQEEIEKNFKSNESRIWELVSEHYTKMYTSETQRLQNLLDGECEAVEDAVTAENIVILQQEIAAWNSNNKE